MPTYHGFRGKKVYLIVPVVLKVPRVGQCLREFVMSAPRLVTSLRHVPKNRDRKRQGEADSRAISFVARLPLSWQRPIFWSTITLANRHKM